MCAISTQYVCFWWSYISVWGLSEIHWVMLTLASRLTNRQSCIKRINLSTQALISVVFSPRGLWWCMSEDGRNVVVYGLYIWVRVNMLCVLLCFKHSSCLIQSKLQSLMMNTIIHSQNVHSAQLYGGNIHIKIGRKIRRKACLKDVYQFTWW